MPRPLSQSLLGVYTASYFEAWAVHPGGLMRCNGWDTAPAEPPFPSPLYGIHGSARDNIYAVGYRLALHFDGRTWSKLAIPGEQLDAVWCRGRDDVYATGCYVYHLTNGVWQKQGNAACFDAISGDGDFVCAVGGSRAAVNHGTGWHHTEFDGDVHLTCVDTDGSSAYAAGRQGDHGVLYRYRYDQDTMPGSWAPVDFAGLPPDIRSLSIDDLHRILLLGAVGGIWQLSDGELRPIWSDSSRTIAGISAETLGGSGFAWAVGSQGTLLRGVYQRDTSPWGYIWEAYHTGPGIEVSKLRGTDCGTMAALECGRRLIVKQGEAWRTIETGAEKLLLDFWLDSSGAMFAVGLDGVVVSGDTSGLHREDAGTTALLKSVWGASPTDVWVVGEGVLLHRVGGVWTRIVDPEVVPRPVSEFGLHGRAPDDVFLATGSGDFDVVITGRLLHWDGTGWSEVLRVPGRHLTIVRADTASEAVVVAGRRITESENDSGVAYLFDGADWHDITPPDGLPTPVDLLVRGAGDIWLASYGGLMHFDGASWTAVSAPGSVSSVWGRAGCGLFVVADGDIWQRPLI